MKNEFYTPTLGTYITRTDSDYLKYEKDLDVDEFKAGRIIGCRSLYGFAEYILGLDPDEVEDEVFEGMLTSGRSEADELIHYFWETAKYPSIVMSEIDRWLS